MRLTSVWVAVAAFYFLATAFCMAKGMDYMGQAKYIAGLGCWFLTFACAVGCAFCLKTSWFSWRYR